MKLIPGSLDTYVQRIKDKEPFTFARYGDGEWASILGHKGQNCDGVVYSDKLQKDLSNTLLDAKDYDYGMLAIAVRLMRNGIASFHTKHYIDITWIEGTFLVAANRHGRISPLLQAMQTRPLLYVGPKHLQGAKRLFPIAKFIEVHPKRAFNTWERTVEEIISLRNHSDFIGISTGPSAKVMIHALYSELGATHTIVDFGSIWDGYVNVPSRKYMRRNTWNAMLQRNLQP